MLSAEQEKEWLKEDLNQEEIKATLNQDFDENQLDYYPVSQDLFHPKINLDVEGILEKVDYEELES